MQNLLMQMQSIGLVIDNLILDQNIHRVNVINNHNKNGWYIGKEINGKIFCTYGRWDTGEKKKFSPGNIELSENEIKIIGYINFAYQKEKEKKWIQAKKKANLIWNESKEIKDHPYLNIKKIKPYIGKEWKNNLIIPIYNFNKELVNLQLINKDGQKKFLSGGQVKDCACSISGDRKTICLCEGFATGASIFEATGYQTIIAFNASNLAEISTIIKNKYQTSKIIICADNDHLKENNVGLKTGEEIVSKINDAILRFPEFDKNDTGTDFNDLALSRGLEAVKEAIDKSDIEIISIKKLKEQSNLSLDLSNEILYPPLIKEAIKAFGDNIVQYTYPAIISILSRAIAGKIKYEMVWPSFYNIKLGGTSTGKTKIDSIIKQAVIDVGLLNFYGSSDYSSDIGLLREMEDQNQTLICLDEASFIFKRYEKNNSYIDAKIKTLLELQTNAGLEYKRSYADKKKNIYIQYPCIILSGNATPTIFNDLQLDDFESGLMQRFDFWYYNGLIQYQKNEPDYEAIKNFIKKIKVIYEIKNNQENNLYGLINPCKDISITKEAKITLNNYSKKIIDECNNNDNEGEKGLISRKYNNSIKYALIHIAASRKSEDIFNPIDNNNIEYGIFISELLCNWKLDFLTQKVKAGDFDICCQWFIDGVASAMKTGQNPTGALLVNRKQKLKKLKPREWDDIVKVLKARQKIITKEINGKTCYFLIEKKS
ncbi:MAG: hypothetical protein A3K77_00785 [Euryarchaeota archaeon RBG_13_31_8]|nr:MAG: hypothetical protein A3K77_00785 [Euryarchaeota archaeon RBG_13_31_8]